MHLQTSLGQTRVLSLTSGSVLMIKEQHDLRLLQYLFKYLSESKSTGVLSMVTAGHPLALLNAAADQGRHAALFTPVDATADSSF